VKQSGAGLTWNATELLSADYRRSATSDGTFDVDGNEGGLSFALDTLWDSDLSTTLDFGYGKSKFNPADIARAKLASKLTVTQTRTTFGLSQDITPTFAVHGYHDQYEYDRNSKALALSAALLRRIFNTGNVALAMLSFPDKTNTWGLTWKPQQKLTLDLSSGKTTTILSQLQRNTRLGLDFQFNDQFNIAVAVTRASVTALTNLSGITVQPETHDTYTDLTAGWAF
jgi:hypothetical protein